jgi:hypothetical protein
VWRNLQHFGVMSLGGDLSQGDSGNPHNNRLRIIGEMRCTASRRIRAGEDHRTLSAGQALSRPVRRNCVARCAIQLRQNSAPRWSAGARRNPGSRGRRRPADLRPLREGGIHGSSDRQTPDGESHPDAAKRRAVELVSRGSDSARRSIHRHLLLQRNCVPIDGAYGKKRQRFKCKRAVFD